MTLSWSTILEKLSQQFPNQFDNYCLVRPSSIAGEGVHVKADTGLTIPSGTYLGITHIYTGANSEKEIPQELLDRGFTPANYGPEELRHRWLRTEFGHKLNAPSKHSDINGKSLHFDWNGSELRDLRVTQEHRVGDIKVFFALRSISDELLASYTIGYDPVAA
jgi:hypothetical protein